MEEKELNVLEAELLESCKVIERVYEHIVKRQPTFRDGDEGIDSMAYRLHNLYGAYEQLLKIVADFFENHIEGARYHADLLRRMKIEIKGVRPALLSSSTYKMLNEMRGFRHFFRYAYDVELDADRIDRIVQIAIQLREPFKQDVQRFLAQLK